MLRAGRTQSVKWTTEGAVKGRKVQQGIAVSHAFRKGPSIQRRQPHVRRQEYVCIL